MIELQKSIADNEDLKDPTIPIHESQSKCFVLDKIPNNECLDAFKTIHFKIVTLFYVSLKRTRLWVVISFWSSEDD